MSSINTTVAVVSDTDLIKKISCESSQVHKEADSFNLRYFDLRMLQFAVLLQCKSSSAWHVIALLSLYVL